MKMKGFPRSSPLFSSSFSSRCTRIYLLNHYTCSTAVSVAFSRPWGIPQIDNLDSLFDEQKNREFVKIKNSLFTYWLLNTHYSVLISQRGKNAGKFEIGNVLPTRMHVCGPHVSRKSTLIRNEAKSEGNHDSLPFS